MVALELVGESGDDRDDVRAAGAAGAGAFLLFACAVWGQWLPPLTGGQLKHLLRLLA